MQPAVAAHWQLLPCLHISRRRRSVPVPAVQLAAAAARRVGMQLHCSAAAAAASQLACCAAAATPAAAVVRMGVGRAVAVA